MLHRSYICPSADRAKSRTAAEACSRQAIDGTEQDELQKYQWTETTQLTLKGDPKPPSQNYVNTALTGRCKRLSSPPSTATQRRKTEAKSHRKQEAEMQDYMGDVKSLLSLYVPPDPQKMQQAYAAGNVSLNPVGGLVNLIFKNYAQPGDQMTITFDPTSKKVISLNVQTYMGQSKDAVTLQIQMGSLPDGTNYVQQSCSERNRQTTRCYDDKLELSDDWRLTEKYQQETGMGIALSPG